MLPCGVIIILDFPFFIPISFITYKLQIQNYKFQVNYPPKADQPLADNDQNYKSKTVLNLKF